MKKSSNEVETAMQLHMQQLQSHYQVLSDQVDSMLIMQTNLQPIDRELRLLQAAQDKVADFEKSKRAEREAYHASPGCPSESVRKAIDRSAILLLEIKEKVDRLEKHTRATYDKLAPKIDQGVRVNQMLGAYGK